MLTQLIHYLTRYAGQVPSEAELELIQSYFAVKKLRKRQHLVQTGDVCTHFGFIVKGAMRQYKVCDKGLETIMVLGLENWWMGDRCSFTSSQPSASSVEAWEETELNIISREHALHLIERSPTFARAVRTMDDQNAVANQERIGAFNTFTSEQRYAAFASQNPDMIRRFPQHMIASYLGMTKETLSRIRNASRH